MERLATEYIELLSSDKLASERFWTLSDRIRADRNNPGVCITLRRSTMLYNLVEMLQRGVITRNELDGFSRELIEAIDARLE